MYYNSYAHAYVMPMYYNSYRVAPPVGRQTVIGVLHVT
jgi:hypothetical protein